MNQPIILIKGIMKPLNVLKVKKSNLLHLFIIYGIIDYGNGILALRIKIGPNHLQLIFLTGPPGGG